MKFTFPLAIILALLASGVTGWVIQRRAAASAQALAVATAAERDSLQAAQSKLQQSLTQAEQERDKLKAGSAEIHRLRAEIATLKQTIKTLEQKVAAAAKNAKAAPAPATEAAQQNSGIPADFSSYQEMGAFAGNLRKKAAAGALSPEERTWLESLKPELEKLEKSPADFAAVQSALIQSAAGITDPAKTQQIERLIQNIYQNAVSRGLDVTSRPPGDASWVEQRHQLDRRGTQAIQGLLNESERAAFDRSFLGIMGVDLGTGVDKSLYPPGFLGETVQVTPQ